MSSGLHPARAGDTSKIAATTAAYAARQTIERAMISPFGRPAHARFNEGPAPTLNARLSRRWRGCIEQDQSRIDVGEGRGYYLPSRMIMDRPPERIPFFWWRIRRSGSLRRRRSPRAADCMQDRRWVGRKRLPPHDDTWPAGWFANLNKQVSPPAHCLCGIMLPNTDQLRQQSPQSWRLGFRSVRRRWSESCPPEGEILRTHGGTKARETS